MRVVVLGTGLMGAGMARSLLRAKMDVVVWNRSAAKARPLADEGAVVADDPKGAVVGADVVITMLFDADATAGVMAEALPAVGDGGVWAQCGTVGLAGGAHLAELAAKHAVPYVDAPVLG
ncbi:NAD(P)-binding domain-containing protein, partial [Actinosynnema sp. NPDC023658]|uniref:NAD(P)-binding domain-containing protein n=1 Tax=Actinosynnema sp. NPDC023658 TaxID=3155465 RepID=UPI0033D2D483